MSVQIESYKFELKSHVFLRAQSATKTSYFSHAVGNTTGDNVRRGGGSGLNSRQVITGSTHARLNSHHDHVQVKWDIRLMTCDETILG